MLYHIHNDLYSKTCVYFTVHTITSIVTNKILGFEWRGPVSFADLMNIEPFPTWVALSFESTAIDKTIIHFRHSGWGTGEGWDKARQWQINAWKMAFKKLTELSANT